MRALLAIALLLSSVTVFADETQRQAQTSPGFLTGDYLMQILASMLLVIGLILVLLWVLRRFNGVGQGAGMGSTLSVVSSVSLGQRERAVLVAAGGQHILVGIAPGHIAALHVFDEPLELPSTQPPAMAMNFSDALRQVVRSQVAKGQSAKSNGGRQ